MSSIEILLKQIHAKHTRPYKGGTEIRVYNLDESRHQIQSIIDTQQLQIVITEVDPILKSVIVHPLVNDKIKPQRTQ